MARIAYIYTTSTISFQVAWSLNQLAVVGQFQHSYVKRSYSSVKGDLEQLKETMGILRLAKIEECLHICESLADVKNL